MKKNIRIVSLLMCLVFLFAGMLTACGDNGGTDIEGGDGGGNAGQTGDNEQNDVDLDYEQYQMGEEVETEAGLTVVINSCTLHQDINESVVPMEGFELQKVNITVENNTDDAIDFSTLFFKYRVEGKTYDEEYKNERFGVTVDDKLLSGALEAGESRTGSLVYDVPIGTGYLMYVSDTDIGPEFEVVVFPQ